MVTTGWESIAHDMIPKEKTNGTEAAWRQNALPQVAGATKFERYNILKLGYFVFETHIPAKIQPHTTSYVV